MIFDVSNQREPSSSSTSGPKLEDRWKPRGLLSPPPSKPMLNPFRSQADDVRIIERQLGLRLGRSTHEIPRIIHRFWTGGPLRGPVLELLIRDGKRAMAKGWQCFLWYSSSVEEQLDHALQLKIDEATSFSLKFWESRPKPPKDKRGLRHDQRQSLEKIGYTVIAIEKLFTQEWQISLAKRAGKRAMLGNWDDVKYFSDLARLVYLCEVGGFHMDVDIGLGDMDLECRYFHNDDAGCVPLMGCVMRDLQDPLVEEIRFLRYLRTRPVISIDELLHHRAACQRLIDKAKNGSGMFNALIASRLGTSHLRSALRAYAEKNDLISGMILARHLLFGDPRDGNLDLAMAQTVPPYVLRLEPDTEESNL